MLNDEALIARCRAIIEAKTGWGDPGGWANRDFIELSEMILKATSVHLSPTTLKRVWGRVRYDSAPHPSTLNTLAQFAGFVNWREFKLRQEDPEMPQKDQVVPPNAHLLPSPPINRRRLFLVPALFTILILLLLAWQFLPTTTTPADAFSLEYRQVTSGVPNSVVFHYDASAARPGDSIFIQQSWDKRKRIPVSREGKEHTAMYYYPGYYKAKLVVNEVDVQERNILIPSKGWVALYDKKPVPFYFEKQEFLQEDGCEITPETVKAHDIPFSPDLPGINFFYVRDSMGLKSNDFSFEAEVRNNYSEGAGVCQFSEIIILFKHDVWAIPLSAPGCAAELRLHANRNDFTATYTDLSGLGCDLRVWTPVTVSSKNGRMEVMLNGRLAFQCPITTPEMEIIGVRARFDGAGGIRNVKFGPSLRPQ